MDDDIVWILEMFGVAEVLGITLGILMRTYISSCFFEHYDRFSDDE